MTVAKTSEGAGIITLLRNVSLPSVLLGRKILFTVHPEYRSLSLTIISLGFYYCQSKKKLNLSEKWKGMPSITIYIIHYIPIFMFFIQRCEENRQTSSQCSVLGEISRLGKRIIQ